MCCYINSCGSTVKFVLTVNVKSKSNTLTQQCILANSKMLSNTVSIRLTQTVAAVGYCNTCNLVSITCGYLHEHGRLYANPM